MAKSAVPVSGKQHQQAEAKATGPDWALGEKLFRSTTLSLREIGAKIGCSHVAVKKHMEEAGIKRDLTDQVQREARRRMVEEAVTESVNKRRNRKRAAVTEREIVETGAMAVVTVLREHRRMLGKSRLVLDALFSELQELTDGRAREVLAIVAADEENNLLPEQRKALQKIAGASSLAVRAAVVKDLLQAARIWIELERQNFGIIEETTPPDKEPLESLSEDKLIQRITALSVQLNIGAPLGAMPAIEQSR